MEYLRPQIIEEISNKLYDRKAYFLAGATDIMVLKKESMLAELPWVDLSDLKELKEISLEDGYLSVGALSTMAEISQNQFVQENAVALSKAAGQMGSPLIRNLATIGGNIANSNPAADIIPPVYALDAILVLQKGSIKREVPVNEFCVGVCDNILANSEIITYIKIPIFENSKSDFIKLGSRDALAVSKVSISVWWKKEEKKIDDIRIAMGAVGEKCIRAKKTEDLIRGEILNQEIMEKAVQTIEYEACPIDDYRSTKEYRRMMTGVLLKRILK